MYMYLLIEMFSPYELFHYIKYIKAKKNAR